MCYTELYYAVLHYTALPWPALPLLSCAPVFALTCDGTRNHFWNQRDSSSAVQSPYCQVTCSRTPVPIVAIALITAATVTSTATVTVIMAMTMIIDSIAARVGADSLAMYWRGMRGRVGLTSSFTVNITITDISIHIIITITIYIAIITTIAIASIIVSAI